MPLPIGREMAPGKVWVQWPHEIEKSYRYCVGFNGKVDLKVAKAGIGGHYQPHTLPMLKDFKSTKNKNTDEVATDLPFGIGDTVKFAVELEEVREMVVHSGLCWNADEIKKVINSLCRLKVRFVSLQYRTSYISLKGRTTHV